MDPIMSTEPRPDESSNPDFSEPDDGVTEAGNGHSSPPLKVQQNLRATLERERERLQGLFNAANAELAERETALQSRTAELDRRERHLTEAVRDIREREAGIEAEARDRATAIEAEAREKADTLSSEATQRAKELEQEALTVEREIAAAQDAGRAQTEAMLAEAEAEAERIASAARQQVDEAHDRVVELLRLREGVITSLRSTLAWVDEILTRIEREEPPG